MANSCTPATLWEERLSILQCRRFRFVARGQGRDQGLLDPGKEACAVDRAIENAGRGDPVVTQGGNERGCLPGAWPWRNGRHHPFAARCPAITPGHVRPRPGLVEKDQPFGNQPRLLVAPSGSRRRDVRALLLGGVGCLFLRLSPDPLEEEFQPEESRQASSASPRSPRRPARRKADPRLVNGDVAILHHQPHRPECDRHGEPVPIDFFQPPYLSALIVPRCFQRCISFTTKLPCSHQIAASPPHCAQRSPIQRTRTTRSRRSSE